MQEMQVYELMYVRLHYVGTCGSVQFILLASLRWCSQEPECQRAWVMTLPLCECDGEACGQNAQWWDAVRHREENEERGNDMQQKWSDWNETTGEILPVLCIRWSLSGLSSRKTQACRVSLSQRNIYIEWVSADCQFTLCFSRFIYLSFYKHGAAQWNEGRRPWMLHKVQRMSWSVFSF